VKDIFGKTLEVGQTIAAAYQCWGNRYDLMPGRVLRFTKQQVWVELAFSDGSKIEARCYPNKLAVIQ
jgi:hypothetical protein